MTDLKVDVAIIGTGTAGMNAYKAARKHTDSVALIEGDQYGTTCARLGCMPSKLLIAPAEARHRAHTYEEFGLKGSMPDVDSKAVMKRVKYERDRFVGFVKKAVDNYDPKHKIKAFASFKDDHTLELSDGRTLTAKSIVIATGSHTHIPEFLNEAGDRLITNEDLFYMDDLPKSVAVIGAGVIGIELAQALHRLDVRTHLFGRNNKISAISDPKILAYALKTFKEEMTFTSNSENLSVSKTKNGVTVSYECDGKKHEEEFDYVLAATGRRPNVEKLCLDKTSLVLEKGVPLYNPETMQAGQSHIFMAGDVNDHLPILHEASFEGRVAGDNAGRYPNIKEVKRLTYLGIFFSDPQIATAGQSYQDLVTHNTHFETGYADFEDQGRSRVMLVNKGLMHIYGCPKSRKILGAEMMGPHHEHLAHLLAWAIQSEFTVDKALEMPFYHPVIEEGLRTALRDLKGNIDKA